MERPDVLKVFMGGLDPDINKPKLLKLFGACGLEPVDVIVPQCRPGKLAVAFIVFGTPPEAEWAMQAVNGMTDPELTPNVIHAPRGEPSWESSSVVSNTVFSFCLIFRSLEC